MGRASVLQARCDVGRRFWRSERSERNSDELLQVRALTTLTRHATVPNGRR